MEQPLPPIHKSSGMPAQNNIAATGTNQQHVLLLCQLPPPIHGLSVVSQRVKSILEDSGTAKVTHLPIGSASGMGDIGTKSLKKFAGFFHVVARLVYRALCKKRADIAYLTFTPWAHTAIRDGILAALGKLVARRTIIHLHTEGLPDLINGKSFHDRLIRRFIRRTELIAIAQRTRETAKSSGLFAEVHLLPNMTEDPGALRKPLNRVLQAGYLGNFDRRKGILEFVDAVAALNARGIPLHGTIAGGPSRFLSLQDLNQYISSKQAASLIDVKGFVSDEEKSNMLMNMDFLIYPTRHDHAPLVLLEGLAHGVIPITLNTGAILSLLSPRFASHVLATEQDFTEQTENIIRHYLDQPEKLARDSSAARTLYLGRFCAPVFRDGVLRIFASRQIGAATQRASNQQQHIKQTT